MAKRSALVCQFLENISRKALENHQRVIKQYVVGRPGIYALYRGSRLYYVGLATDLRFRLRQHLGDKHGRSWDRFSVYLTIGDTALKELETLILHVGKPTGNKQRGKFARSENLLPTLSRAIREQFHREHDLIIGRDRDPLETTAHNHTGRRPVLLPYVRHIKKKVLRAYFKGSVVKARVRADGTVRYKNKVYQSPSLAAAAACRRPTCNGWIFWTYERAPGDWVLLDQLRHR